MRALVLAALAACSTSGTARVTASATPAPGAPACRDAYVEYEATWRTARTEELEELAAGDPDVIDEIIFHELASLPSRDELEKLRAIYAVVDAFLWDAAWPRALTAAEVAIERCGEQTRRPA